MELKNISLKKKLIMAYLFLFAVMMLLGNWVIYHTVSLSLNERMENELNVYTVQTVNMIEAAAEASVKNHLRAIAKTNYDVLVYLEKQVLKGVYDRVEAKKIAEEMLLSQVIGETGYNYVLNSEGVLQVHPFDEIFGKNVTDYDHVKTQLFRKEGYLEYYYGNPDEVDDQPKALYMIYFEPWDWLLSVSSYKSEFNKLVNINDFKDRIARLKFGERGYAYVLDEIGEIMIHPYIQNLTIEDFQDQESQEVLKLITTKKDGTIRYHWKNPNESKSSEKLSVIHNIPDYKWIVGSTVYMDDLEAPLDALRNRMLIIFIVTIVLIIILTVLVSESITRPLSRLVNAFEKGKEDDMSYRITEERKDEIGLLSHHYNRFMDTIAANQEALIEEMNERLQNERTTQNIIETTNEGFIRLDNNNVIGDVNESFSTMLGFKKDELIGSPLKQVFDDETIEIIKNQITNKRNQNMKTNREILLNTKMNEEIHCLISVSPIQNIKGERIGSFGLITDISELKKSIYEKDNALKELEKMNLELESIVEIRTRKLRETQKQLSEIERITFLAKAISGIAHEINTPIGNCITSNSYLQREITEVEEKYYGGRMQRTEFENLLEVFHEGTHILKKNLKKASDLIIMFKKVDLSEDESQISEFDLKDAIAEVVENNKWTKENSNFRVKVLSDESIIICSYKKVIQNIVSHLIDNSVEHGYKEKTEGVIKINFVLSGENVEIVIIDYGKGMSKEQTKHIFDPFYTLHSSQSGTGLSLNVIYNTLVKTLGGTINCKSIENKETIFTITFPQNMESRECCETRLSVE